MCTVADGCGLGVAAAAGERAASGVRNRGRVKSACIADAGLARAQGGALIARRGPGDRAGTRAGARRSARRPRAWRCCTRAITASATGSARRSRAASPRRASRPTWWTCSPPTRRSAQGARARRGWRQVALLLKAPPWADVRTRCLLVGCSIRVSRTTGRLRYWAGVLAHALPNMCSRRAGSGCALAAGAGTSGAMPCQVQAVMHQVPPDCALDDSPGPPPPEPAPHVCVQELVEIVGRSAGVVIMAPPDDAPEAQAALATLLSSLKPKQKARAAARPARGREGQRAPARQTCLLPPALPAPGGSLEPGGRVHASHQAEQTHCGKQGLHTSCAAACRWHGMGHGSFNERQSPVHTSVQRRECSRPPGRARAGARCWWRSRTAGAMSPWTRW